MMPGTTPRTPRSTTTATAKVRDRDRVKVRITVRVTVRIKAKVMAKAMVKARTAMATTETIVAAGTVEMVETTAGSLMRKTTTCGSHIFRSPVLSGAEFERDDVAEDDYKGLAVSRRISMAVWRSGDSSQKVIGTSDAELSCPRGTDPPTPVHIHGVQGEVSRYYGCRVPLVTRLLIG